MSQRTLDSSFRSTQNTARSTKADTSRPISARNVADVLSQMTFGERVRAYKAGVFTRRELAAAAACDSDRMPICNGEFEWIALSLVDLE